MGNSSPYFSRVFEVHVDLCEISRQLDRINNRLWLEEALTAQLSGAADAGVCRVACRHATTASIHLVICKSLTSYCSCLDVLSLERRVQTKYFDLLRVVHGVNASAIQRHVDT